MSRLRQLPALVFTAAMIGCAGLTFHRTFPVASLVPVVAVAVVVPTALVLAWSAGARRISLWLAVPANVVAWLLVVSATVLSAGAALHVLPTPATVHDAVIGMSDSWYRLLSTILPAPAQPQLLVGVHGLTWLAAFVAAEIVVRTRSGLLPLLPGLGVLAVGLLVGVDGVGSNLAVVAVYVALAAMVVLVRQHDGVPPRAVIRRFAAGIPLVATVAVIATAVAPILPGMSQRRPFDLRQYVTPAISQQNALDPLGQVSAWLATPEATLFTVAAAQPENWRIAVLEDFDGQYWRTADRFVLTGSRVPQPALAVNTTRVVQEVTIKALTGIWIPAAEQPVEVTGPPMVTDPSTGVLLAQSGIRSELRYQVTSDVPNYSGEQLRQAVPAFDTQAAHAVALPPGLPDVIRAEAQRATAGAGFPFQQATRLESYLRSAERNDVTGAPSGHTYGHLAHFLAVTHRGTSEQFATAFAVMARSLGLPTRVVVGFQPGIPLPDGRRAVRGGDALVWPEIDFAGLGWVPFYPTPNAGNAVSDADTAPAGATNHRQEIDKTINAAPLTTAAPKPPVSSQASAHGRKSDIPWWATFSTVVVLLILLYLLVILLVPGLRSRRRRRAAEGSAAVAAAWSEALARLRPLGLGRADTLTTDEVAALGTRRLGPQAWIHLATLARLADSAAFSGVALDATAGRVAWHHCDAVAAHVRRVLGWRAALRHRLSPRVLHP